MKTLPCAPMLAVLTQGTAPPQLAAGWGSRDPRMQSSFHPSSHHMDERSCLRSQGREGPTSPRPQCHTQTPDLRGEHVSPFKPSSSEVWILCRQPEHMAPEGSPGQTMALPLLCCLWVRTGAGRAGITPAVDRGHSAPSSKAINEHSILA